MRHMSLPLIFIAVCGALLFGCSEQRTNAPDSDAPHSVAFRFEPGSQDFHGEPVADSGAESCQICHEAELTGNEAVPGCSACHFGPDGSRTPADSDWEHGTIPHDHLQESGEVCNSCHQVNRDSGNGPNACHDCHEFHPTGQEWLDKKNTDFHGNSALECAACHEIENKCYQCHFGPTGTKIPAGVTWTHGSVPHNQNDLTEQNETCRTCHELNRTYDNGPEPCHDCHVHPTGQDWLDKNQPDFHGDSSLNCAGCHDLTVKCYECHFGSTGTKVPAGVTWTHGSVPHNQNDLTEQNETCRTCHELNRTYDNGPEPCHDCHVHPTGQDWLDKNQPDFHGDSSLNCGNCHDLSVKCYECHFGSSGTKVPADAFWTHGTIPHNDAALFDQGTICATCHDLNRTYGNDPDVCHDCHLEATHITGANWINETSADFHGGEAEADVYLCQQCHGLDLTGSNGGTAVSCFSCHTSGDPMAMADCLSCHDTPPATGNYDITNRPDREGAHPTHLNLTADTATCQSCHNGVGSATTSHYDTSAPASVAVLSDYDENGVTADFTFDGTVGSCSNVRCHGGQEIAWTDSITVTTDCLTCHQDGTNPSATQYNSPVSGRHETHMDNGDVLCTECHDAVNKLPSRHFNDLEDIAVTEADQTITLPDGGTFTPGTPSRCASFNCHGHFHMNKTW